MPEILSGSRSDTYYRLLVVRKSKTYFFGQCQVKGIESVGTHIAPSPIEMKHFPLYIISVTHKCMPAIVTISGINNQTILIYLFHNHGTPLVKRVI